MHTRKSPNRGRVRSHGSDRVGAVDDLEASARDDAVRSAAARPDDLRIGADVVLTAVLSAAAPAWRATPIDPATALRGD